MVVFVILLVWMLWLWSFRLAVTWEDISRLPWSTLDCDVLRGSVRELSRSCCVLYHWVCAEEPIWKHSMDSFFFVCIKACYTTSLAFKAMLSWHFVQVWSLRWFPILEALSLDDWRISQTTCSCFEIYKVKGSGFVASAFHFFFLLIDANDLKGASMQCAYQTRLIFLIICLTYQESKSLPEWNLCFTTTAWSSTLGVISCSHFLPTIFREDSVMWTICIFMFCLDAFC